MSKPTTIREFFKLFPSDDACLEHLFNVRFGQGHKCPKCEREAKWYPLKVERAYSCQWCGHHIHPTVGTLFENSRTPLQLWFYVMFKFTQTRHGVSAKEVERELGVTYKCAWRMCRMIREHMAEIDGEDLLGGKGEHVEIDETVVGGCQRGGDVMTMVVPNVRRATLLPHITANVRPETNVHTDELKSYKGLEKHGYHPAHVNHSAGEYVGPDGTTVNSIENFWRHLKCSIKGTHVWVSPKHLETYCKEFEYRFNRRSRAEMMFSELVSTCPKRDA